MPRRDTLELTARTQTPAGDLAGAVRRLQEAALAAHAQARVLGRPVLAWTAVRAPLPDSLDLFARGGAIAGDLILWERPEEQVSLLGIGTAWAFSADGEERFARAEDAWRSILDQAIGDGGDTTHSRANPPEAWPPGSGPLAFFGFAFAPERPTAGSDSALASDRVFSTRDPGAWRGGPSLPRWDGWPAGLLVVPSLLAVRIGGETWVTLALVVDPGGRTSTGPGDLDRLARQYEVWLDRLTDEAHAGAGTGETVHASGGAEEAATGGTEDSDHAVEQFPAPETWKTSVRQTVRAVREGRLRKAVLARGLRIIGDHVEPAAALRTLRVEYPGCTLFAVARGNRCFLGATPERLVRLRNGEVTAAALAGSAARGETEEEDRRQGEMLLACPKDRIEHAVVVEALRDALADVCAEIAVPDAPGLLTLRNAHHLYTPLRASLRERATVLTLTERLHPTPAVAGVPREEALAWIRRQEGWDRGWYAGPVGWIDRTGRGEAAVAIRSALVGPHDAFLFAGCGIVADSIPEQEYAESTLKLQPLLSALRRTGAPENPGGQSPPRLPRPGAKPERQPKGRA